MSQIRSKAVAARALLADPQFTELLADMRKEAVDLFLQSSRDIDAVKKAMELARAVEIVQDALTARIDAETMMDRKQDQHRVND